MCGECSCHNARDSEACILKGRRLQGAEKARARRFRMAVAMVFEDPPRSAEKQSHTLQERRRDRMKLSTRNQIKGKVIEVKKGAVAAKVKIDIGGGNAITSTITVDAVNDLKLKKGDKVVALIKASSVMIGK